MTLDNVTSFSFAPGTYEMHVDNSITVKVLCGISFHVMAENWKYKNILEFFMFLVC